MRHYVRGFVVPRFLGLELDFPLSVFLRRGFPTPSSSFGGFPVLAPRPSLRDRPLVSRLLWTGGPTPPGLGVLGTTLSTRVWGLFRPVGPMTRAFKFSQTQTPVLSSEVLRLLHKFDTFILRVETYYKGV